MTPQAAFEQLNRIAGIAPLSAPAFTGAEAQLPTPFRAATAAGAALGLSAAAAGEIWRLRGGERQTVGVDLGAAAASLVGYSFVRLNGQTIPLPEEASPTVGFYQCADGRWIHLHGGFAHLERRTLDLLNAPNDKEAIAESVAKWNSFALEETLAFLGLCGAVVRAEEEWAASAPGGVAAAGPIALRKIGDAPPLRLPDSRTPLEGVRVLDLGRVLAGPEGARLLASYGAEVLAVRAGRLPAIPAYDLATGSGKRATLLDLARPSDAETLRRLTRLAHVFVDSCRPGALAKLGFSPASLAHIAPGVIYVAVSAYGREGPWAERRGWEQSAQAATGLALEQGAFAATRRKSRRETLPELIPAAVCDYTAGYLAAAGTLAALLRRIREGGSWQVEVSLAGAATWLQSLGKIDPKEVPERWEQQPGLDRYLGSCETGEGRLEFLEPVVRMSKTPPLIAPPPLLERADAPRWMSVREDADAA